jgi:hypothetical protein
LIKNNLIIKSNFFHQPSLSFPGFTKMMIAVGYTATESTNGANFIEIVDIETQMSCAPFPSLPIGIRGGFGGLVDNQVPWICSGSPGYNRCYLYKNAAWTQTGYFLTSRTHYVAVPNSPFGNPAHKFYVVGGPTGLTAEVFDGQSFSVVSPSLPLTFYQSCMVYLNATTVMLIGGMQGSSDRFYNNTYLMNSNFKVWQKGPPIITGRFGHGCGRIVQGINSEKYSTIIAGGIAPLYRSALVEILDDGATNWRSGPNLPKATMTAPMVDDQRGGVLYVGGDIGGFTNVIYRLRHAAANWEVVPSKIAIPRSWHSAFLVPDELTNCQPIN